MGKNPDKDRRAYELRRKTRSSWTIIAKTIGFYDGAHCRHAAIRHMEKNDLPYPPGLLTLGELALSLKNTGLDYKQIADDLNYRPEADDLERRRRIQSAIELHCIRFFGKEDEMRDNFELIKKAIELSTKGNPAGVISSLLLAVEVIAKNEKIPPSQIEKMVKEVKVAVLNLNSY